MSSIQSNEDGTDLKCKGLRQIDVILLDVNSRTGSCSYAKNRELPIKSDASRTIVSLERVQMIPFVGIISDQQSTC